MSLQAGQTLSQYEVLGTLGAGAMGEVYRAHDTRLEREVALKILPEDLADDDSQLRRLEREARALAALNHPHVAQVFDIDRVGDITYIAMELVPGEDLATRLRRGPLSLEASIAVARQVADGLEAAHEAGIIHRDLKPANVRRTPDGTVKVLDFGLAKTAAPGAASSEASGLVTEAGLIVGTPSYMSPEQARGRPVDKRTDVWAFGCLLYECLTGRQAFAGETLSDVLAAVLEREPDWSRLPAGTPRGVRELLARCLERDLRRRLRDVGEARIVLERDPVEEEAEAVPARRHALPALTLVLIAAAAAWFAARSTSPSAAAYDPLANPRIHKLVEWPGIEFDAAISRDGDWLAFASDRAGQFDAWVLQIDGGTPQNLSLGRNPAWSLKVRDVLFDLEGSHVCITAGLEDPASTEEQPLWRLAEIGLLGGELTPSPLCIDDLEVVNPVWSPDGERVAFHTSAPGDPLYVADADGQNRRLVSKLEDGLHQHYPTWSNDGEWIFVSLGRPGTKEMDLWRVRVHDGTSEQLTTYPRDVGYPTPLGDRTVLFVGEDLDGGGPWLWSFDLETREVRRALPSAEKYLSIAASLDGSRLVATVANPVPFLWRVPIPSPGEPAVTTPERLPGLAAEYAAAPRFAKDGTLFYLASGAVHRFRDGKQRILFPPAEAAALVPPAVSPDGQLLAVVCAKRGQARLHIATADGVIGGALSEEVVAVGAATWSPDGEWIAVGGIDAEGEGLFKFKAVDDGTAPIPLVRGYAINPIWSPRDDLIVYNGPQIMAYSPLLAVRPDGTSVPMPDIRVIRMDERMRFLPDGSGLVFMRGFRASQDFWLLDLEPSPGLERRLTKLGGLASSQTMRTFDVDPDGKYIVFDQVQMNSDIVLIEPRAEPD